MTNNFMYKRVNIFLLIMMCLIIVGLAGSAIYFQESFKKLTDNYDSVLTNYTTCDEILHIKEQKLDSCVDDLNSTAKDIGKYDTLYEDKVAEIGEKEGELKLLDKKLKETLVDLRKAETNYDAEIQRSLSLQKQTDALNQEIILLEREVDNLEDDVSYWQDLYNQCTP